MNYKKTEHFEPIAMKCTKEQFESIKPILEEFVIVKYLTLRYGKNYITNNLGGSKKTISDIDISDINKRYRSYYKTFNAETFLKACGIVSEPLYKLTAKEVVHAYENPQWLKDTFKECFVPEYTIPEAESKFNIKIINPNV